VVIGDGQFRLSHEPVYAVETDGGRFWWDAFVFVGRRQARLSADRRAL
jgi:hypothetical protein